MPVYYSKQTKSEAKQFPLIKSTSFRKNNRIVHCPRVCAERGRNNNVVEIIYVSYRIWEKHLRKIHYIRRLYEECQNKENHHELGEIFSFAFRDANSEWVCKRFNPWPAMPVLRLKTERDVDILHAFAMSRPSVAFDNKSDERCVRQCDAIGAINLFKARIGNQWHTERESSFYQTTAFVHVGKHAVMYDKKFTLIPE